MELNERSRKTRGGLGAAELAGEEGDRRRPSRKQTTRSVACGAPRARWRGIAEVEVVGASRGRASEARGGRWPRLWRSHGDGGARLRRGMKGSAVDLRGKAQGPRGEWGRVGGETEGRGVGVLIPSSHRRRGGFGWDVPCSDPGRGNRGRGRGAGAGPAGPARLAAGQGGWAVAVRVGWAAWSRGLPPLFLFFFVISFFYLFSLSILFSFRAFRHFIKWCLLHHNYQCNIWQTPNIFALTLENLGCLSLIHILN